jgi:rhomboid protease GluP
LARLGDLRSVPDPRAFLHWKRSGPLGDAPYTHGRVDYLGFWAGLLADWQPNFALQPWLMFFTYGFLHGGPCTSRQHVDALVARHTRCPLRRQPRLPSALRHSSCRRRPRLCAFPRNQRCQWSVHPARFSALAGIVLSWDFQRRRRLRQTLLPTLQSLAMLAGLNLVLWWAMNGQLAWQTHLGGFVGWLDRRLYRAALTIAAPDQRPILAKIRS